MTWPRRRDMWWTPFRASLAPQAGDWGATTMTACCTAKVGRFSIRSPGRAIRQSAISRLARK